MGAAIKKLLPEVLNLKTEKSRLLKKHNFKKRPSKWTSVRLKRHKD